MTEEEKEIEGVTFGIKPIYYSLRQNFACNCPVLKWFLSTRIRVDLHCQVELDDGREETKVISKTIRVQPDSYGTRYVFFKFALPKGKYTSLKCDGRANNGYGLEKIYVTDKFGSDVSAEAIIPHEWYTGRARFCFSQPDYPI